MRNINPLRETDEPGYSSNPAKRMNWKKQLAAQKKGQVLQFRNKWIDEAMRKILPPLVYEQGHGTPEEQALCSAYSKEKGIRMLFSEDELVVAIYQGADMVAKEDFRPILEDLLKK